MRKKIEKMREEIRQKDREIVRLLNERGSLSIEVGRIKNSLSLDVYDPSREAMVFASLEEMNGGPLPPEALRNIYREVVSSSRQLQSPLAVACLGPEASFSHLAALNHFGRSTQILFSKTIGQAFDEAEKGNVSCAVVPFENSLEGPVKMTQDRMISTPLRIRAEVFLRISQCLMARRPNGKIRRVYSHPQALAQCREWFAKNLEEAEIVPTDSTAGAALQVLEDEEGAAVGSLLAASTYGLSVLARGIEDSRVNITRFVVIGKGESKRTGKDKTSIIFGTPHRPGALHGTLGPFARAGINLLRIESYPVRDRAWKYFFFVDFGGHLEDRKVRNCLGKVEEKTVFLKILGSYPRGDETP